MIKYAEIFELFVFGMFVCFLLLEYLIWRQLKRKIKIFLNFSIVFFSCVLFATSSSNSISTGYSAQLDFLVGLFTLFVFFYLMISGRRLIATFRNIQKELEESLANLYQAQTSLVSAEKFRVVGVMSTGIVQQINKPLGAILQQADWLKDQVLTERLNLAQGTDTIDSIQNEILKIGKVVSGLKSISRCSDSDSLVSVLVQKLFEDQIGLCKEFLRSQEIEFRFPTNAIPGYLLCRPSEIELVLANLIHNSADALLNSPTVLTSILFRLACAILAME
jgi:signal transduction histidine kinase